MMRGATILWAALATVAGTGLFMLKYEVQTQEQRLTGLRKEIVETQESIHVLNAEWSYLNDPIRLRDQAERHLGLHPMKPSQIVTLDNVPMAEPRAVAAAPEATMPSEVAAAPGPPPAKPAVVAKAVPPAKPAVMAKAVPPAKPVTVAKASSPAAPTPTRTLAASSLQHPTGHGNTAAAQPPAPIPLAPPIPVQSASLRGVAPAQSSNAMVLRHAPQALP